MRGGIEIHPQEKGEVKELIKKYEKDIIKNPNFTQAAEAEIEPEVAEIIEQAAANNQEEILKLCLQACNALQPFIQLVYKIINKLTPLDENDEELKKLVTSKTSATDVFTIADGMVQHILRKYLFNDNDPDNKKDFVGEEEVKVHEPVKQVNVEEKNKTNKNYIIEQEEEKPDIIIPNTFTKLIDDAIHEIKILGDKMPTDILKKYTVFVDPIDGTAEFSGTGRFNKDGRMKSDWPSDGKGDQCTILIGFADKTGKAVAGLAYRPVINNENKKNSYAYGWIDENGKGHVEEDLNMFVGPLESDKIRFITSNSPTSKITDKLIDEIGVRVPNGGAGNKILMLLENEGDVYLQDRGVSRWDTCAGEAILRAKGGLLCKLTEFETTGKTDSRYTYNTLNPNEGIDKNDDAKYSKQNHFIDKDGKQIFNATNNLCGLVAITGEKKYLLDEISNAIQELKATTGLKFEYN